MTGGDRLVCDRVGSGEESRAVVNAFDALTSSGTFFVFALREPGVGRFVSRLRRDY